MRDILLYKGGLRPPGELKNDMELLLTKHSRFYADFLPVENSLTGKGLRDVWDSLTWSLIQGEGSMDSFY